MTEAEAKNKWCPFSENRPVEGEMSGRNCVGPGCMAWRWQDSYGALSKDKWPTEVDESSFPRGYCGLAGKP
jgi:hypothetical protein